MNEHYGGYEKADFHVLFDNITLEKTREGEERSGISRHYKGKITK